MSYEFLNAKLLMDYGLFEMGNEDIIYYFAPMKQFALVAIGGASGSVLRYALGYLIKLNIATSFPVATLLINISGSFFIGLLFAGYQFSAAFSTIKPLLIIGLLGGFTTFSSFSYEVFELFETKQIGKALIYVILSNSLGISAAYMGYKIAS